MFISIYGKRYRLRPFGLAWLAVYGLRLMLALCFMVLFAYFAFFIFIF